MVSSVSDFSPIRVDIRIVLRDGCNTKPEKTDGTIAPPSSPQEQVQNKFKRNEKLPIKRELHSLRLNTPKLHSEDYLRAKARFTELPKKLPQIAWKSPESERDSSASSDASKKANDPVDNLQYHDRVGDQLLGGHESDHSSTTKRENISISPFSERRAARAEKRCSAWERSSLQTPGRGYFKGKPALTPFTRLGCYRMQTSKSKLMFLSKPSDEEARCCTADIPRSAASVQCKQRPYSQIPLKYHRSYHNACKDLPLSSSSRKDKHHELFSNFNKKKAQSVAQNDDTSSRTDIQKTKTIESAEISISAAKVPEPEVTHPRSNETSKRFSKQEDGIKALKIAHGTNLQVKQNYTFTAPFYKRKPKFNTSKATVRKTVPKLPKTKQDYHLKKDTVIFYRRNTSNVQLSPFRRTMKINQTSIGRLPPSTNTSVYIFD